MKKITNLNEYRLWTALVTPLTPGLQVDFPSLENLINEQTLANNALLILGSTAEALNLDLETKKQIVNFVCKLKPSVPIMIGVGGHNLNQQKDWIGWLENKNIDALLMVSPIYAKPGNQGQINWFTELMDKTSKPVMLYNVPGRSGSDLSFEAVQKLKKHKNFWAIKEASGSVEKFKSYLQASGNGSVFCGDDALMNEFAHNGAHGLVSVASNVWPSETHLYTSLCLSGKFSQVEGEDKLWHEASNSLFTASNPIPAKNLLATEGRIKHKSMMPPLSELDLKNTSVLVELSKKIKTWYKQRK